ncbi:MAG: hypothetical protein IPM60_15465 [Rhodospirillales bacterium]|nr:hypothetical protein [Rhodospirillales bacterium]
MWASISRIANSENREAADLARRLRERKLYKALDINIECPALPGEQLEQTEERRQREIMRIESALSSENNALVLKDAGSINIYGEFGAEQAQTHKMLSIRLRSGSTHEITELSPTIRTLSKKEQSSVFIFRTTDCATKHEWEEHNDGFR